MFVPMMEILLIIIPYSSHSAVLIVAMTNMVRDTSLVDFDFQVFITCGKKVVHDNNPATIPIISLFMDKWLIRYISFDFWLNHLTRLITSRHKDYNSTNPVGRSDQ